ncbi:DUF2384 domain-containing protein [bacterium]|nr:DUF2384 domain-containing protein [bacterium]
MGAGEAIGEYRVEAQPDMARVVGTALCRAREGLGLTLQQTSAVVGLSTAFLSKLSHGKAQLEPGSKPFQLALMLVRIYRALFPLAGGDEAAMRGWLEADNSDLGAPPLAMLANPAGLTHVLDYLDGERARI